MKGQSLVLAFVGLVSALFCAQSVEAQTNVVINEINLVTGPNYGQFVELYGEPNTELAGMSLVILKSNQVSGQWTALVQSVVGLDTLSLNDEGFLAIDGSGWQNTVASVVLTESPVESFEVNQPPVFSDILDGVLYGTIGVSHPQMQPLVATLMPSDSVTITEATSPAAGPDGLSRVPDGGQGLDQSFVMQALSPGTTNVLPCEGGDLSLIHI